MDFTNIGRYEIKSELGRGGMATVYRAYDPSFDREVAIKVLPREFLHNPQFLDRFKREIKTIAQLEHPAIVPVYDVGEHDGIPFFVMRYMPGGSLSDMIKKGRFSIEDTARTIERLASALSYAHRKGIIHRDLKAYMSPEQATGDALDHRSDVYGMGVIVYQMLTGKQPYNADTPMGVAIKHVTDPVPDIRLAAPDLPEEIGDVMKTVLAKDKNQRYASAVEFARALNQVAFGNPGNIQESSPTVRLIETMVPTTNKKLYIGGAVGLVVLLILIFGGIKLFSGANQPENIPVPTATIQEIIPVTEALATDTAVVFAPACRPPAPPPVPLESLIQETNRFCTTGVPYTTYLMPKDATFEPMSPDFKCTLAGEKNGKSLVTCSGKPLFAFDLKVCMPVDLPPLDMQSDKCSSGNGFDEKNQCCAAPPPENAGCVIFKTGTTGCGG